MDAGWGATRRFGANPIRGISALKAFPSLIETFGRNRKSIDNFRGRGRSYVFVSVPRLGRFVLLRNRAADQDTKRWCNPIGWKKLSETVVQRVAAAAEFRLVRLVVAAGSESGGGY